MQHVINGLVSGSFLALLALGLAVIFGMLGVVNFAHGSFYMLGAFGAYVLLSEFGVNFWIALAVVPLVLWLVGIAIERLAIRRLSSLDPLYNFLLTFGIALVLQDVVRREYGVQSQPYDPPFAARVDLGFVTYPAYQLFVLGVSILLCLIVWLVLTRTRIGMIVRAATERPELTGAFGIDVGRYVAPIFGFGVALAGFAGVLAAPMRAVQPLMGADLIITLFAVVVIGGLGSIAGSVVAGFGIGVLSTLGNLYVPVLSQTLVFILMAIILLWRPTGLFGREEMLT